MAHNYHVCSHYQHAGHNLPVPHTTKLHQGLHPGTMITVMGEVPPHADRFAINLQHGHQVLLHVNPRFSQGEVVRNSKLDGWGPEEKAGGMPLQRGQPFGCIILAQHDKYLIAFNGQHFTEYQFRAPYTVNEVVVSGDVLLHKVEVSSSPTTLYNVTVPFKHKIEGGMHHGRSLTLSGVSKHHPERIRIDLQKDQAGNDIALHIDIRFHVGEHKRVICMNNKQGRWGEEVRSHVFPFTAGVGFELTITSQPDGYAIVANGAPIAVFGHRDHDLRNINHLHIQGDLTITKISF